ADCDGNKMTNGCEINILTNASHCGGCGMPCSPSNVTPACTGGNCTGPRRAAFLRFDGNKRTKWCEGDRTTSQGWGVLCPKKDGQACNLNNDCASGSCCNNTCVANVGSNINHCGGCNMPCGNSGDACIGGTCKCNGGAACVTNQIAAGGQRCALYQGQVRCI